MHRRETLLAIAVVATAPSAGCSILLDPERHDDVERCRYDDDCSAPDDLRYDNICTVAEEYLVEDDEPDLPFSKICSPRPAVSCDPSEYDYESTFRTRARQAEAQRKRYETPCPDFPGARGCPPDLDLGCAPGLTIHPLSGRCDDDDESTPPAIAPESSVALQDVKDQFCRSVYCDIAYACHIRHHTCQPCELGAPIGRGGCGDLYPHGERSPVYQTGEELDGACREMDGDFGQAYLGELEAPPEPADGTTGGAAP